MVVETLSDCDGWLRQHLMGVWSPAALHLSALPVSPSDAGQVFSESPSPLAALLWSAGPLAFSLSDLIRVATHLGWLDAELRWIARCDQLRESAPPDSDAIQRASESFRYEHDLLTAEETERWLEARSLRMEDLALHCERLAVAESATASSAPVPAADATPSAGQGGLDDESWRIHLWFSGQLPARARRCAWLLIAAREAGEAWPDRSPDLAVWRRWADLLREQRAALLAGPRALRTVEVRRWPLTRLSVELTEFPNEETAREAELCLNEGSATMDEIVQGAGAVREVLHGLVDELAQELQQEVITIPIGGVRRLGKPDEPPRLVRVLARTEPSLEDPAVGARIATWLQEDLYGGIERDVISWEHPLLRLT
jgi:hypothetical protein